MNILDINPGIAALLLILVIGLIIFCVLNSSMCPSLLCLKKRNNVMNRRLILVSNNSESDSELSNMESEIHSSTNERCMYEDDNDDKLYYV